MDPLATVLLVLGVLVVGFGLIAVILFLLFRSRRVAGERRVSVTQVGGARVVDIPVMQISRISLSLPMLSLGRSNIGNHFRVTPTGIEYKIVFGKQVPYDRISLIDVPYPSNPCYLVVGFGGSGGIGVLTNSPQATHAALIELSRHCRLTPRALQWLRPPPPRPPLRPRPPAPSRQHPR